MSEVSAWHVFAETEEEARWACVKKLRSEIEYEELSPEMFGHMVLMLVDSGEARIVSSVDGEYLWEVKIGA